MDRLANFIDRINQWLGKALGWLTLLMVLLTFTIVVLRYFFNWGSIGLQEAVMYMHALVFMAGSAYALQADEHVRVDIFYREMTEVKKAWVNLLGTLLFLLPVCVTLVWISFTYVERAWSLMEASPEPGGLPLVYLLKTFIPLMGVLLFLQGVSLNLRSLQKIRAGNRS